MGSRNIHPTTSMTTTIADDHGGRDGTSNGNDRAPLPVAKIGTKRFFRRCFKKNGHQNLVEDWN